MKIYSKTRKSHQWNEDRFINGPNFSIVLDGATPLKSGGQLNEARWLVNYIKKNILYYDGDVKSKLISVCKDAYRDFPSVIKEDDYLPSASACWAEWTPKIINIGILGDCEVTAVKKDGNILRYADDKLKNLDYLALKKMAVASREHNTTFLEARKFINDTLIKHRKLANKPDGYTAIVLSQNIELCERSYTLTKDEISTLYLYSDGFSQAFENLKIYRTHSEMFKQIKSIDKEIEKIVKVSLEDPDCELFPRFKKIDDITATKIDF